MTTANSRTRDLSDRAFRVLHTLTLHPEGDWVDVGAICTSLGLTSHQVRRALLDLHTAGMAERDRRYVRDETGRRTHRTYFRLTDDISEASV
ncbi:MarR family transcriptional regulator [Streptomyces sp. NPDC059455]|uniref:MarR family transcriptional regulator n=1 Tax=Streptomyces sp. NPDC059455 TaxID=3346837 RepID=UPI00369D1745